LPDISHYKFSPIRKIATAAFAFQLIYKQFAIAFSFKDSIIMGLNGAELLILLVFYFYLEPIVDDMAKLMMYAAFAFGFHTCIVLDGTACRAT
jgi:hypothetical protein